MSVKWVVLVCVLLFFGSQGYCGTDIIAENEEIIVAEYNKVNVIRQEYSKRDFKNSNERRTAKKKSRDTVIKADAEIKKAIVKLIGKLGDFETVLKNTNKIISWREFPKDNSHVKRMEFKYGKALNDKRLRINYMSWTGVDGEVYYLMQNSFWNSREIGIRIVPSTYVLAIDNEKVSISELFSNDSFSLSGADVPYPLGLVKWEQGKTDVLILRGPSGSGSYSHYFLYSYNAKINKWEIEEYIAETQKVVDYSYKEDLGELCFKRLRYLGTGGSTEKKVQEVVFKMNGDKGPLKLDISINNGVEYSSDYAPINIVFRNTGQEEIKFGNSDNDTGKGYIGRFSVKLHKNNGEQVFKAPGVSSVSESLEGDAFQIAPGQEVSYTLDIAKLYNVNRLKAGEYKLHINFLTTNPSTSNYFSGMLKSNIIDLVIEKTIKR